MTAAAITGTKKPGTDEIAQLIAALSYDRTALSRMFGTAAYHVSATTNSNTAAASSPILNLSNEGILFPTDTERLITVAVLAANGANRYRFTTQTRVLGGTNPTIVGSERYLTDLSASYGFTTADGSATTEDASACIGPEWWDGAAPVAGAVASNAFTVQWLGTNSPVRLLLPGVVSHFDAAAVTADARTCQHGNVSLANGTSDVFISDVATPTAANFSNGSVVRAYAKLFPPVHCPVLIDTSPTPDKVFIGALGIASDVVTWEVDVFIGDLIRLPLL